MIMGPTLSMLLLFVLTATAQPVPEASPQVQNCDPSSSCSKGAFTGFSSGFPTGLAALNRKTASPEVVKVTQDVEPVRQLDATRGYQFGQGFPFTNWFSFTNGFPFKNGFPSSYVSPFRGTNGFSSYNPFSYFG